MPTTSLGTVMVATTRTLPTVTCSVMASGEMPASCAARLALKALWAASSKASRLVARVTVRVIVALVTGALEGGGRDEGGLEEG